MCSGLAKVVGAIRFQPDKEWAQGDEGRLLRAADCLLRGASRAAVVDSGLVPRDDSNAGMPCPALLSVANALLRTYRRSWCRGGRGRYT